MPRPSLVNTKRNPAALVRYGRVRPEPREMVMKKKSLAMLVAALSIGVSSIGLMSATAKDAAIKRRVQPRPISPVVLRSNSRTPVAPKGRSLKPVP